jgi:hypothetical protein
MSRGACTFRQRDVSAAIKAARDAGVEIARVEIDKDGRITITVGKPADSPPVAPEQEDESKWAGV